MYEAEGECQCDRETEVYAYRMRFVGSYYLFFILAHEPSSIIFHPRTGFSLVATVIVSLFNAFGLDNYFYYFLSFCHIFALTHQTDAKFCYRNTVQ